MLKRPCYRCGRPTRQNPCPSCVNSAPARPRQDHRRSRQERGYDAAYEANRKLLVDHVRQHGAFCVICGQPIEPGQKITAEHIVPLRLGGGSDLGNLAPAHSSCNSRGGGRARRTGPTQQLPH